MAVGLLFRGFYMALRIETWILLCGVWRFVGAARAQAPATNEQPWASILYTAVVRGKVALPCDISPPSIDDGVALILWYKDEDPSPIFTLDARQGGPVEKAGQVSSDHLGNRAFFNMINRPAFLQLDPVQEQDAGEYRCRVDFHKARTVNTVITLKVIVPPGDPVIKTGAGQILKGLIGPYNEGEPLKLTCEAEGGKPRPSVTWWREYSMLDDSFTFVPGHDVVRNELEIDQLRRHDLLAVLTCQASNNNITVPASSAITLDLNLRPADIRIEPSRKPLSSGKITELTCTTTGSRPPATISWWKGSKLLKPTQDKSPDNGEVTVSVLSFIPAADDNGKYLSCRAENPRITGSALEEGWKLDVYYAPQVTLEMGNARTSTIITEGIDVYLECNIRANPWVTDIRWFSDEGELLPNASTSILISNQSLVIRKVQRHNAGRYYCMAFNSEGSAKSNEVFLRVRYAPICRPGQQQVYGVSENESVQVLCQLDGDPPEVKFRWTFNNSQKSVDIATIENHNMQSVATYKLRTQADIGTLSCYGSNTVGEQKVPCMFQLVPAGPPDQMTNCSVQNYTDDSITVECIEGYNGGLSQNFMLEVFEVGQYTAQRNVTTSHPLFMLDGLPGGRNFHLVAYAVNAKGKSRPVFLSASTLQPPEKLVTVDNNGIIIIRPVLGILIGIVVALVVTAVFVMILMRIKNKGNNKVTQRRDGTADKYHTPLKKDTDDSMDNEEKGPDIIPAKVISRTHYTDDDRDDPYNSQTSPTWNSMISRNATLNRKPNDIPDVEMYGPELHAASTLPRTGQLCAQYTKVDFHRHSKMASGMDAEDDADSLDNATIMETLRMARTSKDYAPLTRVPV